MNSWLALILAALILEYAVDTLASLLNLKAFQPELPPEFRDVHDSEKYQRAFHYQTENTYFGFIRRTVLAIVLIGAIVAGFFESVDRFARGFGLGQIGTGLVFLGTVALARSLLSIPFAAYHTFGTESRFGFNRTTPATFWGDIAKGLLLSLLLGAPLLAALLWFFESTGERAWLWSWLATSAFSLILAFLAPAYLMPLFNRFKPLEAGPLRSAIEDYARKEKFSLEGVYTMDGSKRSTKANAFFAGFGKLRRLVLFDTLIEKNSREELMAVLAHEVGHFRLGHIPKQIALSIAVTGATFFAFSKLIGHPGLFEAFKMSETSVYASFVFISLLYSPFARLLGVATNFLSRKFEFEADAFSVRSFGAPEALASALKKLSSDHLSNLTPHRLEVILDYSHPPVLERVKALRKAISQEPGAMSHEP